MKKINWPQAFAEVSLLVLGILMALGADALNDWRVDRNAEEEYLASLKSDFERTRTNFAQEVDDAAAVRANNLALLRMLSRPVGSVPPDSLLSRARGAFWTNRFAPVMATYRDMVNSGKLELIQSDSLRLALAEFEATLENLQAYTSQGMDQWNQVQVPFIVSRLDAQEWVGEPYVPTDLPESPFSGKEDIYWSLEFRNLLVIEVISKHDIINHGRRALIGIERILRLIEDGGGP